MSITVPPNSLSSPLAGDVRNIGADKFIVVNSVTHGAYFFIFFLCLTIIILFYLVSPLVTVVVIIVFTLFPVGKCWCYLTALFLLALSNIPIDRAANINTFFVFKVCYRKMILNK
ncbi:MAG: hypothetical protein QOA13_02590 [Nitrososphaeraceae archaeon]|nr:hypothetical protein [Nitrososphaeraceae archaeon]MDW0274221.1 hypothetical protein [Nitrososphaeraceae archaeon]